MRKRPAARVPALGNEVDIEHVVLVDGAMALVLALAMRERERSSKVKGDLKGVLR